MSSPEPESRFRPIPRTCYLAFLLTLSWGAALQAQPCLPISLDGLPPSAAPGEKVQVSAALSTGCNYKVVDEAELVCRFPHGELIRRPVTLSVEPEHTHGTVEFNIPEVDSPLTAECFIEFTQCNETARTCDVDVRVSGPDPRPATPPPWTRRPSPTPSPPGPDRRPPSSERPDPPPSPGGARHGGTGGRFFKAVGWIGVAVGLAAYADAGAKEEEGLVEEARDSEDLGNQVLVASGVLLLLGHSIDGASFADDRDLPPPRRFRPMLAIDPVNRAAYVQVTVTFD